MRVAIAGGGIIGLTCAWRLVESGHQVTVYDPAPGRGATYAAAGMIAPAGEAWFGEESLLRLGMASAALWPAYASAWGVELRTGGSLLVGRDVSDLAVLRRSVALLAEQQVPVHEVDVRTLEPTLSERVVGGVLLPSDASVDPREVVAALLRLLGHRVVARPWSADLDADVVVRCTGTTAHPAVRAVRGEILRIRTDDPPTRVVRGLVHGEPVYLVPRANGEVVVGATSESHDRPPAPTVGGVARLLNAARALAPSLETAEIVEVLARDRPGTPDNGPLLGWAGDAEPGVVIAAGHYRGGVLLAPVTAETVLALLEEDVIPEPARAFGPGRFDSPERRAQPA